MRLAAIVFGIGILIGCSPVASPLPSAVATPTASLEASPSSSALLETPAVLGPLAIFRSNFGMQARNEGTLRITDHCVFLERGGERELLAWPEGTTWNAADSSISYRRTSGQVITIQDGDHVVLGGGGSSRREDGLTGAQWASRLLWIARPADECLVDVRFVVSDVEPG